MQIEEAIIGRRSNFPVEFTGEKIQQHHIERMLELANWAPTHKRTEPWRFRVYEGDALNELIDTISNLYVRFTPTEEFRPGFAEKMMSRKSSLSHLLIISMKRHESVPEFEEIASVSMAVQNLWLYLASQSELGGYWSSPSIVLSDAFHHELNLESDERCLGLFYLGVLKEDGLITDGKRGDWREKVQWFKN